VQRSTSSSGPWTGVGTTTARKLDATGLANGYNYDVSVAAYNAVGSGVGSWCHVSPVNMDP
jgi:hypothetical protein